MTHFDGLLLGASLATLDAPAGYRHPARGRLGSYIDHMGLALGVKMSKRCGGIGHGRGTLGEIRHHKWTLTALELA